MGELIGIRSYARMRGVSHVAIIKAVKTGRITLVDGKIDPVAADLSWRGLTDPSNSNTKAPGSETLKSQEIPGVTEGAPKPLIDKAEKRPPARQPVVDSHQTQGGENVINYATQRAIREAYNARTAKLDFEERVGKLVSGDEVRVTAFNAARAARDRLLGIAARVASIFAGMTDEREIERVLDEEIRKVCNELSKPAGI